jgi:multimeric flavodoxin WrbA
MSYEVYFIINGRRAKLETLFNSERDAEEAASAVEEQGCSTEIVNLNE